MQKDKTRRARRKAGRIAGLVVLALMLLVIAVNAALAIQNYARPDKIAGIFGVSFLVVKSDAMEPAIRIDDLILFRRVDTEKLQKGDIIVYQTRIEEFSYLSADRIIDILAGENGEPLYVTQGDHAENAAMIIENEVRGIYFARIPKAGGFIDWTIEKPWGMAVFFAAAVVLYLAAAMLRGLRKDTVSTESQEAQELAYLRALEASLAQAEEEARPDGPPEQSGD